MSSFQLFVWLTTNPNVIFLNPLFLPVSQLYVTPTFGRSNVVILLFIALWKYGRLPSVYGDTPWAVFAVKVSDGVIVICE